MSAKATKRPKPKLEEAALARQLAPCRPSSEGAKAKRPRLEPSTRVAAWLVSVAASAAGRVLADLIRDFPPLADIVEGIAESAPYLWDLICADPDRFVRLLTRDPDDEMAALLGTARSTPRSRESLMRNLRRLKADAALLIALADIGGVWPVARVTRALTDLADATLNAAIRYLLRDAVRRGALNPPDPRHPEIGSGYIVLAMGKMGAYELNFSSDIDLIVFFDPAPDPSLSGTQWREGWGAAPERRACPVLRAAHT